MDEKETQPAKVQSSELQQAFDAQTQRLFRTRFLWFTGTVFVLSLALLGLSLGLRFAGNPAALLTDQGLSRDDLDTILLLMLVSVLSLACYALCFFAAKLRPLAPEAVLRLSYLLVLVDGILHVGATFAAHEGLGLWGVAITHVLACSFLPWTPRQAVLPLIPVLLVWAVLKLILGTGSMDVRLVQVMLSPAVGVPGYLLCMLRHSRRREEFERAFFYKRYREVRRELVDARKIHESLFPKAIEQGPIAMEFCYQPAQQLGGDFLYVHRPAEDPTRVSAVLLDVTGHGILAALTVNRLWGELQRIYAEDPDVAPGRVLALLNRYAHLTMASHSVYLTALCLRIDVLEGVVDYASGGHPPAFIRGCDGEIKELFSTAMILGVCGDEAFEPGEQRMELGAGDALLAYTDGVIESMGVQGRLLGVRGLREMLTVPQDFSRPAQACAWLIDQLGKFRSGPPTDDTLVVVFSRPTDAGQRLKRQRMAQQAVTAEG